MVTKKLKRKIIRFIVKTILYIIGTIIAMGIIILPFALCGLMMQHDWLAMLFIGMMIPITVRWVKEEIYG